QLCSGPLVRPRRIKSPLTSWGPKAQPCSPVTLLPTGLAERRGPHQGLPRIRPTIRMSLMGVVDLERVVETGGKILGRTAVAPLQKPAGEDATPPLHLVEP